jgi:hypothetical protein
MRPITTLLYFGCVVALYITLGTLLVVKLVTYSNVVIPSNNTGYHFDDVAQITCGDQCSLIHLVASHNCKLACTTTNECECYHKTPIVPTACFLYRECGNAPFVATPVANNGHKYFFGMKRT